MPRSNKAYTSLLTAMHASVDGLCACCMFMTAPSIHGGAAMIALFIAYNVLAFVTQPFVGQWIDRQASIRRWHLLLSVALSVGGAVVAYIHTVFPQTFLPFLMVALIGLGNSVFHVFAGRVVTLRTGNDMRHLGILVSSGALGLMLGGQFAGQAALLLTSVFIIFLTGWYYRLEDAGKSTRASNVFIADPQTPKAGAASLLVFLCLIVFLRSFVGKLVPSESASIPHYAILAVVLAVAGKASGGFMARRLGAWQTLTVTLLLTATFFLLGYYHAACLLLMTLCINFSMPITLHLANATMPHREGFAFGLLAAVLAPGVGLAMLCGLDPMVGQLLYPLISTILIEAVVLLLMHERRWTVLGASVAMNILTNVPLNAFVLYGMSEYPSWPIILLLEASVMAIETILFRFVTTDWKQALRYGILCNVVSYLAGLLFTVIAY